jgi:choline kinase
MDLIVLASGLGSRLKKINKNRPKCLLKINNKTILDYTAKIFDKFNKVYIVGGYKYRLLKRFENKNIKIVINKDFRTTNMVHSLFKVKNKISSSVIVIYADILFDQSIINQINKKTSNTIALKKNWLKVWKTRMSTNKILNDAEDVKFNRSKIITIGGKLKNYPKAQYMGIIKFKKKGYYSAMAYYKKISNKKIDMTTFINEMIKNNILTFNYILTNKFWYEIDTPLDLKNFKKMKIKL